MNYDFFIWGNWSAVYLAIAFLVIVLFYLANKEKLHLSNFTNYKFKLFFGSIVLFVLYYVFIYDPYPNVIRSLFLIPINIVPRMSFNFNIVAFAHIFLFLGICIAIVYVIKLVSTKISNVNPFKK